MSASTRWVVEYPDGGWAVDKEDRERVSDVLGTQKEAIDRGHVIVRNLGGGELIVKGRDGRSGTRPPSRLATTIRGRPAEPAKPLRTQTSQIQICPRSNMRSQYIGMGAAPGPASRRAPDPLGGGSGAGLPALTVAFRSG